MGRIVKHSRRVNRKLSMPFYNCAVTNRWMPSLAALHWPIAASKSARLHPAFFLLHLLIAIILRAATFGDPNLHVDESFYQVVGIAMHHGAVPYVDVWDRKPLGLFLIYYLIAFISDGPVAYQAFATIFAAGTAWIIGRIASDWSKARGGLLAGVAYLLWLEQLQGFGGQAPIFYNLFIATAALLVFDARKDLAQGRATIRVSLAMLLAGIASTMRLTRFRSIFSGAFRIGTDRLFTACPKTRQAHRAGLDASRRCTSPRRLTLVCDARYWDIFWQAMVTSNVDKPKFLYAGTIRALITFMFLAPLMIVATLSLATWQGDGKRFVGWWFVAAIAGLIAVPNFYMHYSLPLLVPLCIATGAFLARPIGGPIALAVLALWSMRDTHFMDFAHTRWSRRAMSELVTAIRLHQHGGMLFVVDGPPQLYVLTGNAFPTPLVFPHHLGHEIEKDTSHLSTFGETRRVLSLGPDVIVMPEKPRQDPPNMEVINAVEAYTGSRCVKVATVDVPDLLTHARMNVWAECRRASTPHS